MEGDYHKRNQRIIEYPYEQVFNGLISTMLHFGMSIRSADKTAGKIMANLGGEPPLSEEHINLALKKIDNRSTIISLVPTSNFGLDIFRMARHKKYLDKVSQQLLSDFDDESQ
ncbi:MAG: hypothetical protein HGB04_04515 [Chlorobiaceae bacterium]|nr:hypothetical protein [Chlorobiaceae bacterium]